MKNNIKINKLLVLMLIVISTIFFSSCNKKETLLFLNWGEYINDDVVKSFETKVGNGIILCMIKDIIAIDENNYMVPIEYI